MSRTSLTIAACVALLTGACAGSQMSVRTFPDTRNAIVELRRGSSDAVVAAYPELAYTARESMGTVELMGGQFDSGSLGIGVSKAAPELKTAVTAGLRAMVENGAYANILEQWAISQCEIPPPDDPGEPAPPSQIPQLADGKLHVGFALGVAPMAFRDEHKEIAGADVELAHALGKAMGIAVELVPMESAALLSALTTGQVDVLVSSVAITPENAREADFVPYLVVGSGILVRLGNPARIFSPRDLCGKRIALADDPGQVQRVLSMRCD